MHHLYISIYNDATALQQEREALVAWCVENGVKDYDFIEDNLTIGRIPEKRIKAAGASHESCEAESKIETADKPKQRNGIRVAQTETPLDDTRLGGLLQAGGYENCP